MRVLKAVLGFLILLLFLVGMYCKIRNIEFRYTNISNPWHTKILVITANDALIFASILSVLFVLIIFRKITQF